MALQQGLEAEIARRQAGLNRSSVFSVFSIGTGHTQGERNNTIAALGHACVGAKIINDGPTGVMGNVQGWGMNDALRRSIDAIKAANPMVVNMTGHSRGAILCHMIAHAMISDPATSQIKINMMLLDPVHQSKLTHEGAEILDNPNLLSYQAIIMMNEDKKIAGSTAFPFKFVQASTATQHKIHYINMPGTHGSGSQQLTSPIGKVVYELIANYMRSRRTVFNTPVRSPIEMCDLFAQIHLLNPASVDGASRLLFDDKGTAGQHNVKSQGQHGTQLRAASIIRALQINTQTEFQAGTKVLPTMPINSYIFNAEHAFYFKCCFPYFFKVLAASPLRTHLEQGPFSRDFETMGRYPALAASSPLLFANLRPLFA
jgi:hypothetical protein